MTYQTFYQRRPVYYAIQYDPLTGNDAAAVADLMAYLGTAAPDPATYATGTELYASDATSITFRHYDSSVDFPGGDPWSSFTAQVGDWIEVGWGVSVWSDEDWIARMEPVTD